MQRKVSEGYKLCKSICGQYFEFREGDFYYVRRSNSFNSKRFSIIKVDNKFIRFREDYYSKESIFTYKEFNKIFKIIKD